MSSNHQEVQRSLLLLFQPILESIPHRLPYSMLTRGLLFSFMKSKLLKDSPLMISQLFKLRSLRLEIWILELLFLMLLLRKQEILSQNQLSQVERSNTTSSMECPNQSLLLNSKSLMLRSSYARTWW